MHCASWRTWPGGASSCTRRRATPSTVAPVAAAHPVAPVPPVPPSPPVPGAAPVPPVPPVPPTPPAASPSPSATDLRIQLGFPGSEIKEPHKRGSDRTVMGGNVKIPKGETARDVTVFGGNVDIEGDVTGDVTVFGGRAEVHSGAHVKGDATVFGGTLRLDDGSEVGGDVSTIGGSLSRDPGASVGGDVLDKGGSSEDEEGDDEPSTAPTEKPGAPAGGGHGAAATAVVDHHRWLRRSVQSTLDGVRLAAVLFVLGTLMLALAGRRMDALRGEIATRPMRSLAMGLLGAFCGTVLLIALCVTVIGIPIAMCVVVVGGFAVLAAMCAVLSVVGEGLLRHRTENPYVHLAVGCAIFAGLAAIPYVGSLVVAVVLVAGVGILVATRGAGYFVRKNGGTPYRTPETV
jgi:hypothetical protein